VKKGSYRAIEVNAVDVEKLLEEVSVFVVVGIDVAKE
jgi:hypothetical protein